MKPKHFLWPACALFCIAAQAQGVGIGTNTPHASTVLHVDADTSLTKGLLVSGTSGFNYAAYTVPDLGAGSRLMFFPAKIAFRAGYVSGRQWDNSEVGFSSVAMGYNAIAKGLGSTSVGYVTTASGDQSTALGNGTTASGGGSTATGGYTTASGSYSTAMGYNALASASLTTAIGVNTVASAYGAVALGDYTTASGQSSTAMGTNTTASGIYATATGAYTTASGSTSLATGVATTASGVNSTAMGGYVSTNGMMGSFIIGDASTTVLATSTAPNQFTARFTGGYHLRGGSLQLDGGLRPNGGLYLPTPGGTAANLDHYEEMATPVNFTNGAITFLSNYNIKLLRVGKQVTLTLPTDQVALTGTGVGDMLMSNIPARFRPATNIYLPVRIRNGGVDGMGLLWIRSDGVAWLKPSASGGTWNGSGNCGFYATSLMYSIQ